MGWILAGIAGVWVPPVVLWSSLLTEVAFPPPLLQVVLLSIVTVLFSGALTFFLLTALPRALQVDRNGVTLDFWIRRVQVDWMYVAPDFLIKRKMGLLVRSANPGLRGMVRMYWLDEGQARMLIHHPSAPSWVMPPEAAARWGVKHRG